MPSVDDTISAADANRRFSEILRMVKGGRSVTVTSHGTPVARVVPVEADQPIAAAARAALLARLRQEQVVTVGTWSRDELYEDPS